MGKTLKKIWLDTDPGFDDWLTMLLLGSNRDIEWLGVSVVAGNAPLAITYDNAGRIKANDLLTVPIYAGCDQPLSGAIETAQCILGDSGMPTTGATLPPAAAIDEGRHAVDALIDAVRSHPGQITLLAIAPMTNLATALARAPDIAGKIVEIVMMGGSSDQGNHTAAAEFNIYADPEAADQVFRAGIPMRMFGLNLCRQLLVTGAHVGQLRALGTPRALLLAGYLEAYVRIRSSDGSVPMPMYDPVVALYLEAPELFQFRPAHVAIELNGTLTRGMTVCEFRVPKRAVINTQVADIADGPAAIALLMRRLSGILA
ncbi:nucleoside hydrolase [Janthinobacterium agaricidamnosum]|uniref:Inosine-uridine preferring nucleoside hydrolase n=1 Tax=Janthinobacterium agaricidamnosum NBRC 102515 = DSM 9628 TaxID=1349767 RepID=W0UX22_9BURK|nr:nucleoside hydrolase [Janthinobacterium agaricidamnosum]CDG81044.1 inosine-uridine preferring nucleoside hydrolase [Janthinobacterium agaricidamnosum NBRC 102515 = DSM 9628]